MDKKSSLSRRIRTLWLECILLGIVTVPAIYSGVKKGQQQYWQNFPKNNSNSTANLGHDLKWTKTSNPTALLVIYSLLSSHIVPASTWWSWNKIWRRIQDSITIKLYFFKAINWIDWATRLTWTAGKLRWNGYRADRYNVPFQDNVTQVWSLSCSKVSRQGLGKT